MFLIYFLLAFVVTIAISLGVILTEWIISQVGGAFFAALLLIWSVVFIIIGVKDGKKPEDKES